MQCWPLWRRNWHKLLNSIDQNHFSPRMNVDCYRVGESRKKIYLLAKGRVINLVGAEGNSPEVMSISFSNQFLSIVYLSQFHEKLDNQIYKTPKKIERKILLTALDSFGLKIDRLTPQQSHYFNTWFYELAYLFLIIINFDLTATAV